MNAVIYARYSSAGQRDVSIDDQVKVNTKYAIEHKMTVIRVYADRAVSGTTDKRPQFQKMIADSNKKLFDTILVYKTDRFARNRFDSAIYKKKLKDNGVKVVSVMEPIPEGYGGDILEAIYETMAETYSKSLSENVNRGMRGNAAKGLANCRPSFGYQIDKATRKYIVDPVNGPIVTKIFDMAAAGKSGKTILQELAKTGIHKSACWLYTLLHNERYTGVYIYDDIRIEGGMPMLVEPKTFHQVNSTSQKRKKNPQAKPETYMLSGKIYCGYCGNKIGGEYCLNHAREKYAKKYSYYVCLGRKTKTAPDCQKRRISADFLEHEIVVALHKELTRRGVPERLADCVVEYQKKEENPELNYLKAELSDTSSRLSNVMKAIERGLDNEVTSARMEELIKRKKELLSKINTEQLLNPTFTKEQIVAYINEKLTGNPDDRDYAAGVISTFVTRVDLFDDYAVVCYDAKPGENTVNVPLTVRTRTFWWTNE